MKDVLRDPGRLKVLPEHTAYTPSELVPKIFSEERVRLLQTLKDGSYNIKEFSRQLGGQ